MTIDFDAVHEALCACISRWGIENQGAEKLS
jgi:hypothetical protein